MVGFAALPAHATAFGPATASLAPYRITPVITLSDDGASGTADFDSSRPPNLIVNASDGALSSDNTTGFGKITGPLTFSTTASTAVSQTLNSFILLYDNEGSNFEFDVSSVLTTAYSVNADTSYIALYVTGTMGDSALGYDPTDTSLTITFNKTGSSAYSTSLTLANPPTGVPEPTTLAVLGAGLVGLTMVARRRRQTS